MGRKCQHSVSSTLARVAPTWPAVGCRPDVHRRLRFAALVQPLQADGVVASLVAGVGVSADAVQQHSGRAQQGARWVHPFLCSFPRAESTGSFGRSQADIAGANSNRQRCQIAPTSHTMYAHHTHFPRDFPERGSAAPLFVFISNTRMGLHSVCPSKAPPSAKKCGVRENFQTRRNPKKDLHDALYCNFRAPYPVLLIVGVSTDEYRIK